MEVNLDQMSSLELAPEKFVELLQKNGSKLVSLESLERDFAAGAPRKENGNIPVVEFVAWLKRGRSK